MCPVPLARALTPTEYIPRYVYAVQFSNVSLLVHRTGDYRAPKKKKRVEIGHRADRGRRLQRIHKVHGAALQYNDFFSFFLILFRFKGFRLVKHN